MLKKLVIAFAVLLVVSIGAAGIEAYRLYSGINSLVNVQANRLHRCPHQTKAFPAGVPQTAPPPTPADSSPAAGVQAGTKTTPAPTSSPCEWVQPQGKLPTLGGSKRINILLLGSDNDKKGIPLLSQTMMVVTIDPLNKRVSVLSIPRDFWVFIPGVSTMGDTYTYEKIDAAMSDGIAGSTSNNPAVRFEAGVSLARATVEDNFGIPIDYYAWVGLNGFIKVIDTLHGVIVDAQHPIVDDSYPNDITGNDPFSFTRVYIGAGPQFMDGTTALQYVRSRHADLVGDFGRGARQQQMLLGIRRKVDSLGITDIGTIISLTNDLKGYVKSDVGTGQLLPMYDFGKKLNPAQIQRVVLSPPTYSAIDTAYDGESIVTPDWPAIRPVVKRMFAKPAKIARGNHHTTKPPPKLTKKLALQLFTRVSGATPPPKSLPKPPKPPRFSGHLFFVESGNVWQYNGKTFYQVTHSSAITDESVTKNAKTIVYARRSSPLYSDIFMRDRKSGATQQLTNDNTNDGAVRDEVWAYDTAVSPDGSKIIYASDAYKLTSPSGFIDLALYVHDATTGSTSQITAPAPGAGGDADPRFDPRNPNKIVYTRYYYLSNSQVASRLMVLNLTTDNAVGLTPYRQRISQPAWQPGGRHMAYIKHGLDGTTLYEARYRHGTLDTKRAVPVASGMVAEPSFSPDGTQLAFYKLVGNTFQIWVAELKDGWPTGNMYQLLSAPGLIANSPLVWTR